MRKKRQIIQQGDVLFVPIDRIPETAQQIKVRDKYYKVAVGELTGYSHKILADKVKVYQDEDKTFLELCDKAVGVVHSNDKNQQEHKTQMLDNKFYQVFIVREYDYDEEEARKIRD